MFEKIIHNTDCSLVPELFLKARFKSHFVQRCSSSKGGFEVVPSQNALFVKKRQVRDLCESTRRHIFEAIEDVDKDEDRDGANEGTNLLRHPTPQQSATAIVVPHHRRYRHLAVGKQPYHDHCSQNLKTIRISLKGFCDVLSIYSSFYWDGNLDFFQQA